MECGACWDRYGLEDVAVVETVGGEGDVQLWAVGDESVGVVVLTV